MRTGREKRKLEKNGEDERKREERGKEKKTAVVRDVKNEILSCSESQTGSVNSVLLLKH